MDEIQKAIIGLTVIPSGNRINLFDTVGTGLKKYSDDQPRDENGRFGSGGGSGAGEKTDESNGGGGHAGAGAGRDDKEGSHSAVASTLATSIRETGGFTYSPVQGAPTTGYMVSIDPKEGVVVDMDKMTGTKLEGAVDKYLGEKDAILRGDMTKFAGAWVEKNECYFDISTHSEDKEAALQMGTDHGQQAIWDIVNMESIPARPANFGRKEKTSERASIWSSVKI